MATGADSSTLRQLAANGLESVVTATWWARTGTLTGRTGPRLDAAGIGETPMAPRVRNCERLGVLTLPDSGLRRPVSRSPRPSVKLVATTSPQTASLTSTGITA